MHDFGVFCKSFRDDLPRVERLLRSFERHNVERLPLLLCVPDADRSEFLRRCGTGRFTLISDEALLSAPVRQSWRSQQRVKLHVHRAEFARALLLVDSDFQFIRPFGLRDFVGESGVPRFVLSRMSHRYARGNQALRAYLDSPTPTPTVSVAECAQFTREAGRMRGPSALQLTWAKLRKGPVNDQVTRIQRLFPRPGPSLFCMPGPIWRSDVLRTFHTEFLAPRGLTAADVIAYAPWEYHWIAEWQLHCGLDGAEPCEPLFLHFATESDVRDARAAGLREEQIARSYIGVALAARHFERLDYT